MEIKGVHAVRSKGRLYYYHRATRTRLTSEPGTAEFLLEIRKLDERAVAQRTRTVPGSLGDVIRKYKRSPEFTQLQQRTRDDYDKVLDFLRPLDEMPIAEIDSPFVIGLRDRAFKPKKPKRTALGKRPRTTRRRFANYVLQVLSTIFKWAKPRGLVKHNPVVDVPMIARPKDAPIVNRAWKDHEREAVLAALPAHLQWPIALAMYAMLREGDIVAAKPSVWTGDAVDLEAQRKTGNVVWLPAHRELKAARKRYDAWLEDRRIVSISHLAVNSRGRPWTEDGLRASFFKIIRRLVADGKVEPGLTIHGLRHTAGKLAADAGADARTIAALLGHKTTAMAEHYSREADTRRRARDGIRRLERSKRP